MSITTAYYVILIKQFLPFITCHRLIHMWMATRYFEGMCFGTLVRLSNYPPRLRQTTQELGILIQYVRIQHLALE